MLAEAICIASGPSLAAEDIEAARLWRMVCNDRQVIVTNTTFRNALWADVLFAMDSRWWATRPGDSNYRSFVEEARATFKGELVTSSHGYRAHKITHSRHATFGNSGSGAIHLAFQRGAQKIILLGYDCQRDGVRSHHHADHPKPLHNALSLSSWPQQFQRLADALKGKAEIINASRQTALKVWPCAPLEQALHETAQAA